MTVPGGPDEGAAGRRLADLTTLRLGGPADSMATAGSIAELVDTIRVADTAGVPVLLVGGGSNLVVGDAGWPGLAVLVRARGLTAESDGDRVVVTVAAGEPWDSLVARTVARGWSGLESLSGIPGLAGATPVQNVGAYGQEVAEVVSGVRVLDRSDGRVRDLDSGECRFGYRTSLFKHTERYVVLSVTFALRASEKSGPVRYPELARLLGLAVGDVATLADVRVAVLSLRRGKGMVLDPADHDTWSVGSFFTNPVLGPADLAAFEQRLTPGQDYPSWPVGAGRDRKLSAAWLIDKAGFHRGHGTGPARISSKHTLALTHLGGGSTADLIALAREVRDGVRDQFGVTLAEEPRLVGVTL